MPIFGLFLAKKPMKLPLFVLILFFCNHLTIEAGEIGFMSRYDDRFQGSQTASGERYTMQAFTAAHKSLPFGTRVRVMRLDNGKMVEVRINDRGVKGRGNILMISHAAAKALQFKPTDDVQIELQLVVQPLIVDTKTKPDKTTFSPQTMVEDAKNAAKTAVKNAVKEAVKDAVNDAVDSYVPPPIKNIKWKEGAYDLVKIGTQAIAKQGFGVQVAALTSQTQVNAQVAILEQQGFDNILLKTYKRDDGVQYQKVILGPFDSFEAANNYRKQLEKRGMAGFVVDLAKK